GQSYHLAVVGGQDLGHQVVAAARTQGIHIALQVLGSRQAAESQLRAGALDAAIVQDADGSDDILVRSAVPDQLVGLVQVVSRTTLARKALEGQGVDRKHLVAALNPEPLPVHALEPPDPHHKSNSAVAFVGVLLLYGQLFGYGFWVASGVVEEKSSRVVELLLSTIRPSELLTGKIVGIGFLGLLQLLLMATIGLVVANAVGLLSFPAGALSTAGLVVVWFVLGFAFYSTLFAVAGSLVSRQEDLQNTMTPISLVILASFFISIGALSAPDSLLARVASFVPPSAPLAMPPRLVAGAASWPEGLLSAAISLVTSAVMIRVASRIYSSAILRTGRVGLRDVWRSRERAVA
ncbi:MAG: ABC transporter permease, partial [Actinomycetota bacterium]|nr:ABC transporter permease [Actinomycetota bacterium]